MTDAKLLEINCPGCGGEEATNAELLAIIIRGESPAGPRCNHGKITARIGRLRADFLYLAETGHTVKNGTGGYAAATWKLKPLIKKPCAIN